MGNVSNLAASRKILSSWRVTAMGQVSNLAASREILSSWRVTAMGAGK